MRLRITVCETKEEIGLIAALAGRIWREHFPPIIGTGQVEYMVAKFQSREAIEKAVFEQGYRYYMAWDGQWLIGYCGVVAQTGGLFLSKLYIEKPFRGQGVGRALFEKAKAYAAEKNLGAIRLTVNKYNGDTVQAYRKMGFAIYGSGATDIGGGFVMDDYFMEYYLEP